MCLHPSFEMKEKGIELANISKYRGELMGLAILFVMLFHVSVPRTDAFFGLRRMGNIGVDMFFFLSGIGLWYSWTRNADAMNFFKKRLLRIYPAWLILASLYYIPDFLAIPWVKHSGNSTNIIDLIGNITINWDFWLNDELTFWYIPATMMLYLITPAYLSLIIKHPTYRWIPAIMIAWCVAVKYVVPINETVGHIEIFWSRVPIYLIGLNFGATVKEKRTLEASSIWLILLTFVGMLATCIYLEQVRHGRFPLFLERMLYIPLTITGIILLCIVLKKASNKYLHKALIFVGGISLELYLLHNHFILIYIERLSWHYWAKFFATLVIALPLAWLLHIGVEKITTKIERNQER